MNILQINKIILFNIYHVPNDKKYFMQSALPYVLFFEGRAAYMLELLFVERFFPRIYVDIFCKML